MNFNFSGMFGGGFTNNLNKNNFNFSAYAPKKEEVVKDPIDIVSNKTPEAKVEVLEGAADVAITKQPEVKYSPAVTNAMASLAPTTPDPIAEAIQSVQPKPLDLGMDFSVTPATAVPSTPDISNLGGVSGFDVSSTAVDNMMETAKTNEDILNPLVSTTPKFEVGAGQAGLIDNATADELKNFVGTDEFSNVLDQYSQERIGEQTGTWEGGASRDVLNALGIPHSFETQDDYGRTTVYNFDEQSNDFKVVQEYGGTTKENEMIKAVAETAVVAMATAGLGSTLSASLNVSTSTGAAIASGAVSAAQGGNLEEVLTSALSAGFAEEVKGLQTAAEAVGATKEVIAFADTMKAIETGIDLVKAVDSGDVLGAISSTLDLTGNGSPASYIKEALGTTDAQTAGILKVIDKQLQGESLDDSVKSGAATWVKEGGIKEIDLDIDFGTGDWETPEAIKVIGDKLVEGASWANENFIKPVVKTVEELGAGAISAASEANRFVQREIIDEVEGFLSEQNQVFQTALEPIKEDFSKLNQTVRTELANFDTEYLQPVKNDISQINKDVRIQLAAFDDETLQPIKKDIEDVITKVDNTLSAFNKDYIKPIDEKLSQTNKDVRDQLATFDKDYLQPIKNDLSETNKTFQSEVDKIQLALSETNRGFRDELSGFEDTYLNPIKEDVKGLAGDLKTGLSETNKNFRQGLSDFEDDYLQPIKGDIESLASDLKDGLSDTNKYVREQLAGFDDDVLQPIKNEIEDLIGGIDGLDVDMSGVKDMLSSVWDALGGLTTGLAATQEAAGKPSGNFGELAKLNTQYGEQYQFEDIRNNSLLNNELFS